jgi:predicted Zn-dependent protease
MRLTRVATRLGLAALSLALLATATRADEADLKKKLLALNEITGDKAISAQIQALLDDPAGSRKLLPLAVKMAKEKDEPLNLNATLILARAAQGLKDAAASETLYRVNAAQAVKLGSGEKIARAYLGLAQLFYENGKYDDAIKACQELLEQDDAVVGEFKPLVLRRLILITARKGDTDRALAMTDRLVKADPAGYVFNLELKARVQRLAEQFDKAARTYQDLIERVQKDENIKEELRGEVVDELRYALSGVYVDLKQIDKAAAELKALLEKDPNNPTYNNDLGYIWADHDMNLEESEKLIRKALVIDKKNAAYLDSLGWVLFKQKKYQEAKKFLLESVSHEEGRHTEIYDHLAEVHLALGEKAEAVAAWKKAIEVAGPDRREQQRKAEVEKKLKANE